MGGAAGEAFANTLKSPGMLPEHVLAREAIQNSVGAGTGAKVEVRFRASVVKGAKKTAFVQAADLGRIAERSNELMLSGANCLSTLNKPQKELCLLYVEDYNAVGLSGDPHDKDSNFYRLLLSLGDRSKSRTAQGSTGGSYALAGEIGDIDLFLAGPPCQGHSNLNNKTRREDPRNLLYVTAVALGVGLQAKSIVIENVPDVVNDKSDVVNIAKALLKAAGYAWIDSGILAADHLGGAQTRKRYFLVASRVAEPKAELSIQEVAKGLKYAARPLSWAIGDLLSDPSQEPKTSIMDTTPTLSADNLARIHHLFDNDLYDLPNEVRPDCHKDGHTYPSVYGRLWWDKPSQTITTGFLTPGRGRYIHPLRPRVISPHEAARIQSFPDNFSFVVDPANPPSRTGLQKWIGDAVPPLLGYAAALPLMVRM
ncbi:MAG: DNA cytosine methyltransferase [bacterium]